MHNELFHIGPLTIYGYGLMIAIGIIVAFKIVEYRAVRRQMEVNPVLSMGIWSVAGGFVGAKLLYWITQWRSIWENPKLLLNVSEGFVVYGGIVTGIAVGYVYCKRKKLNFLQHLDLCVPAVAIAQGFGRIGCLLAGCCYGVETNSWLGITFHDSQLAPNGVSLVPTQIIESLYSFALFFVLIWIARRNVPQGLIAMIYLLGYSVGRFIIEFYRGDIIRGHIGMFSTSQLIALAIVVATLAALALTTRRQAARP